MNDWQVFPHVAADTAVKAVEQGVAKLGMQRDELYESALMTIRRARDATQSLLRHGFIAEPPEMDA